jgi:hypothetical protein
MFNTWLSGAGALMTGFLNFRCVISPTMVNFKFLYQGNVVGRLGRDVTNSSFCSIFTTQMQ